MPRTARSLGGNAESFGRKTWPAFSLAHGLPLKGMGTTEVVDPERYGELTDEFEQMHSAEASPKDGSVIVAGNIDDLLQEMFRYLVGPN